MKKFAILAVLALVAFSAQAETDYIALPKISDIVRGVDNGNQIQELRVREKVTVEGTRWDDGSGLIDTAAIEVGPGSFTTLDASGNTTLGVVTGASIRATADMRLDGKSVVRGYSSTELLLDFFPAVTNTEVLTFAGGTYDSVPSIVISYRTTSGTTQTITRAAQIISATASSAVVDCDAGLTCDVVVVGVNGI